MNRKKELEILIHSHRELYYKLVPAISDEGFDSLVDELRELSSNSSVLKDVETPKDRE